MSIARGMAMVITAVWVAAMLSACRGESNEAGAPAGPSTIVRDGPLTVQVEAERARISTVHDLTVKVTMELEPGYLVIEPEFAEEWGAFTVLGLSPTEARLTASGGTRRVWTVLLEPFLPGTYALPPLTFGWAPVDEVETRPAGTLQTGEIAIHVESVLGPEDLDIAEMRGPMEPLPHRPVPWGLLIVVGLAAIGTAGLLAGIAFLQRKLRQAPSVFGPSIARIGELRTQLPELRESLRDVWHEAGTILARCAAEHLEPHAQSMGASELLASAATWYGIMEDDRHRFRELVVDLERVRFQGGGTTEVGTRTMLDEMLHVLKAIRGASDLIVDEAAMPATGGRHA
ncbi:MAG: hypothetical protein KF866_04380 [Phycisphaeraceae bacterium]|nr:hypothetical protein [Phycisphaeraceae bacterium]MCW5753080.1 hypothetical protein [Phycisphaeraceae bacterium]